MKTSLAEIWETDLKQFVSNLKVALKHYGSHGCIVYIGELDINL